MSSQHTKYITTSDGLRLFTRIWSPSSTEVRGLVYLLHGYAEHSGRYQHVAAYLVDAGFVVAAIDHRGHGQSDGKRAWAKSMDLFVDDINFWMDDLKGHYTHLPQFLLAHSMGALLAILYCIKKQPALTGVVLSAAAVKISADFSPLLQKLAPIIGTILPHLPTTKVDPSLLASDPAVGENFVSDPLNYSGGILAGFGWATLKATREARQLFGRFDLPVLILHGAEDKLSDPQGSVELHQQASSTDKQLNVYDNLCHEILNEVEKEAVLEDVTSWLKARST